MPAAPQKTAARAAKSGAKGAKAPARAAAGSTVAAFPGETVERLRDYYRPHNERLYALPGVTFRWSGPNDAEEGSR